MRLNVVFAEQDQVLPIEFGQQEQLYPIELNPNAEPFFLPIATTERLGGIKVGDRLVAELDGRLSVTGGADVDMDEMTNQDIERIIQGG